MVSPALSGMERVCRGQARAGGNLVAGVGGAPAEEAYFLNEKMSSVASTRIQSLFTFGLYLLLMTQ